MASSHPVITSYFHASNSASWLSTAFLLTSTSLQPLFGRFSDTFGRRPLYLSGLLFLAATTGWCALAQSIGSFIAARAFCGLGAAAVLSMGNIIMNDLVSIQVRSTYQAYINIFYGGGSTLGAAFGGFLCDKLGWRLTFAIQIPFLLAVFVNAFFTTPTNLGPNLAQRSGQGFRDALKGFDFAGSVLLTGSVAFLILGLNLGGNVFAWKHPFVITSLVVAVIAGAILLRVESKAARPIMPLPMLFSRPRGGLVFNNFFANIGINAIIFNAPLYFQAVKLESASMSGFRLAGPSLALMVCGVSSSFIMTATGRMKWLIVVGSLSMVVGAVCLSSMWNDIPTWLATLFLVPASIGQGFAYPATFVAVLATSTQEDQAVMTSTLTLWRQLGTVMGVSFSSVVLQNALTAYLNALVTGHNKDNVRRTLLFMCVKRRSDQATTLLTANMQIILTVRQSVRSIRSLDPKHQHQGKHHLPVLTILLHKPLFGVSRCSVPQNAGFRALFVPLTLCGASPLRLVHHFLLDSLHSLLTDKLVHPVIDAYSRSLRVTFISTIAVFVIVNALVLSIRLPGLRPDKAKARDEDAEGSDEDATAPLR